MFNVGFAELILILLVAFLIVGPKELPKVARWLGRLIKQARRMFKEFQEEVGIDDTIEELQGVQRDLEKTIREADPVPELTDAKRKFEQALRQSKEATYSKGSKDKADSKAESSK